jgi:hypothetical protein
MKQTADLARAFQGRFLRATVISLGQRLVNYRAAPPPAAAGIRLRDGALWPPNPRIRKLSPGTTMPRTCGHNREVAARRRSRITAHSKMACPPPTRRQITDAGPFRVTRIPIRPWRSRRRTTGGGSRAGGGIEAGPLETHLPFLSLFTIMMRGDYAIQ